MHGVDDFFAEQDKRMSIPDEDVDEYIKTHLTASGENRRSAQGCFTDLEDRSASSMDVGLHALYPSNNLQFPGDPCKPPQEGVSFGVAPRSPGNKSPGLKMARKLDDAEEVHDSLSIGSSSEPSPAMHASEDHAKRRRTTREYSISEPIVHTHHANASKVLIPDPNASRNGAGTDGVFVEGSSEHASAKHVGTRTSRRARSGTHGQKGVFSSTALAPVNDPITPVERAQTVQTIDPAASVTEEVSVPFDAPPVSTPDNPTLMESFSPLLVSSIRKQATVGSTTSLRHVRNNSEFPKNHTQLFPTDDTLAAGIHSNIMPSTSSRSSGDSHVAGCLGENPVPRAAAGFNTTAYPVCSNITSPGNTPSEQSRHVSRDFRAPSADAVPSSSRMTVSEEVEPRKTTNSGRRSGKASGNRSGGKKAKEKAKLISPLEYAQKLQSGLDLRIKPKGNHLKGKRIFYVGSDMIYASATTRGRMEYIVKHGGKLIPKYDPANVTHIVTDAGVHQTLRALSLKSLSDIPDHIPTITWDWVISGHGRARKRKLLDKDDKAQRDADGDSGDESDLLDFEFMHAAFSERIDAGCKWKKKTRQDKHAESGDRKAAVQAQDSMTGGTILNDSSGDISHITTFSQEGGAGPAERERHGVVLTALPPEPLHFKSVDSRKGKGRATLAEVADDDDPLAEYYAQARAEREAQWNRDVSDSDDGDDYYECHRGPVPRRGFACDIKGKKPTVCVNQSIVDKLEELRELHKAKSSEDDCWRAYSYGKCIPALRNHPKPIRSFGEARSIHGVGEKTAMKIMEIVNTGDLKRIKYENTQDVAATRLFQGIYGVGRYTAFTWFASGLRTLDDVRVRKGGLKLSKVQEIGLEFYGDINSRMPRKEVGSIFEMIKPIALTIDSKLFIEIMGSYRRGKADCGDIDILITRPTADGKTHQGVLHTLLERLHAVGIITEDLSMPDDFSDLELVYHGLCRLPELGAKRRRIDFLCVPWASRGAALLYYTGDDIFNRAMRLKANKQGYSLNQRGLYAGVLRDPHDRQKKVCEGHIIASETEEEIFKILGVPWQEPHERVRG